MPKTEVEASRQLVQQQIDADKIPREACDNGNADNTNATNGVSVIILLGARVAQPLNILTCK